MASTWGEKVLSFWRIVKCGGMDCAAGGPRSGVSESTTPEKSPRFRTAGSRESRNCTRPVTVESVTSFLYGGLGTGPGPDDLADLDLLWAENDWMAEDRWQVRPLRVHFRPLSGDPLTDIRRTIPELGSFVLGQRKELHSFTVDERHAL